MNYIAQIVLASACGVCATVLMVGGVVFALREGRNPRG